MFQKNVLGCWNLQVKSEKNVTTVQTFLSIRTTSFKNLCRLSILYKIKRFVNLCLWSNVMVCSFNPLPALTYQNVMDLNFACQAKCTQTYWHVHKFKCPPKKTQPSCPCSRDLNWTGKGLISICSFFYTCVFILQVYTHNIQTCVTTVLIVFCIVYLCTS
jgi:hypothetical protein